MIFAANDMAYEWDRPSQAPEQPSLAVMTRKAIKLLAPKPAGDPEAAFREGAVVEVLRLERPGQVVAGFSYCSQRGRMQPKNYGSVWVETRPVAAARFTIGGSRGKGCRSWLVPSIERGRPRDGGTMKVP